MPLRAHAQVLLPFPDPVTRLQRVKSTLIQGSIASIKAAGCFEKYEASLADAWRERVLGAVAGTWLPLEVALAHYQACDAMVLSQPEAAAIGRGVFDRVGPTFFGTVLRLGKSAGITPWPILAQIQRFWDRGYDGGAIRVTELGPKDARLDLIACPIANSAFYRSGVSGLLTAVIETFSRRAIVKEPDSIHEADSMSLRAQWV
jgi:hypothetical protein